MSTAQPIPMDRAPQAHPSPMHFFQTIHAYQSTAALLAAIELDVFTSLAARGTATAAELAAACKASPRGMRVLCDYLVISGLLMKSAGSPDWSTHNYSNTPDSQLFLDARSPASLAGSVSFLGHPDMKPIVDQLVSAVRRGGTGREGQGSVEDENPAWVDFARTMVPILMPAADRIPELLEVGKAGPVRILDVAAGHGMFGIRCAQANPQAHITALDWKNVLEVAKENAAKLGVSDRYATIAGSAFDVEWGGPYDVVLLTNFLHHFDTPTNEALLRKSRAALKPNGRVAILEFVPNDDRVTPPATASFAMIMLRDTPGGDAYTFHELSTMMTKTGFKDVQITSLEPHPESVLVARA
jgi:2-polyprenyl-3-methyl-5-hydroxy-6-metoxy-1,4-benzoquinol methylase